MVECRPIPGFAGYLITSDGKVIQPPGILWHRSQWKALKQVVSKEGIITPTYYGKYPIVYLQDRRRRAVECRIGHLVLEAFVGPKPEGTGCLHRNDDPSDNRLENLYWGTPAENARDRILNGKQKFGAPWYKKKALKTLEERIRKEKSGEIKPAAFNNTRKKRK